MDLNTEKNTRRTLYYTCVYYYLYAAAIPEINIDLHSFLYAYFIRWIRVCFTGVKIHSVFFLYCRVFWFIEAESESRRCQKFNLSNVMSFIFVWCLFSFYYIFAKVKYESKCDSVSFLYNSLNIYYIHHKFLIVIRNCYVHRNGNINHYIILHFIC